MKLRLSKAKICIYEYLTRTGVRKENFKDPSAYLFGAIRNIDNAINQFMNLRREFVFVHQALLEQKKTSHELSTHLRKLIEYVASHDDWMRFSFDWYNATNKFYLEAKREDEKHARFTKKNQ